MKNTTLRNRCQGGLNAVESHLSQRLLTEGEEEGLVDWLRWVGDSGLPLSKRGLYLVVKKIVGTRPGHGWYYCFMKRNGKTIKSFIANPLDLKRAEAFNRRNVQSYYDLLEKKIEEYGLLAEDITNMDEKGLQLGGGRKMGMRRVIGPAERQAIYRAKSDKLELITLIECISASGQSLNPLFIFSGKRYQKGWLQGGVLLTIKLLSVAVSENGWTDEVLGYLWFTLVYVPWVNSRADPRRPCLLIVDGHGSYSSALIIRYVWEHLHNTVHIICLPPHTTHKLQPLDVGVFGPIGKAWSQVTDDMLEEGRDISKKNLISRYLKCRADGLKPSTIVNRWRATGVQVDDLSGAVSIDRNHFTEADFAPARYSSTRTQFPDCIPS
ncbi:DDE-domain-containing protein, partial [Atractiella rhizophila]